ncbi:MAG: HNH endonuclease [Planctomycetaceae bacterium]|nr:HNH endonuclease [Planctomycetaceae bacterium]
MVPLPVRQMVRERAGNTCEYCRLPQHLSPMAALQIEHIIPIKHGGSSEPDNLALACISCNLHKGSNLTGIDPVMDEITPLFNPREDLWEEHFVVSGIEILGKTPVGRATVRVLNMNSADRLVVRLVGDG